MNQPSNKPRLAVIAGPTASGKSAIALRLAEQLDGRIINADASQVYSDLRVLSARPDEADLARAPHALYGVMDGAQACSAAAWTSLARAEIETAWQAGQLPILVGGTGLYLRTLLHGIAPVPDIDPAIREAVRALPVATAYEALGQEDPAMAARLRAGDRQRVARALEVVRTTGRSLLDWQRATEGGLAGRVALRAFIVAPERAALYARCDARFEAMLRQGALAEVERLAARHLDPGLPVMKALGVPPLLRYVSGTLPLAEATAAAQQDTRRYAKRQLTWFRNQTPDWHRIDFDKDEDEIVMMLRK